MKAGPPPLLPLLRSRIQAEALAAVLLAPEREWSLTELAGVIDASVPTVQREMKRAEEAGVVQSRKLGNTRLVQADPRGVLTEPLTELLLRSFGPKALLAESLHHVSGVDAAYLFGSWATRYAGQRGPVPEDIDVLVIGRPDRNQLDDVIAEAERRLARPVQATIRRAEWWDEGDDAFHAEIAQRPVVPLFDELESEVAG